MLFHQDIYSQYLSLCLCVTVVIGLVSAKGQKNASSSSGSQEHHLIRTLFKRYDPSVRPRYNSSHSVNVHVRFSLQQLNDLDEKRQILKMSGWLTAEWQDEFLEWNPSDFGGLKAIVVEPSRLWVPKLAIGNSANKLFDGEHYKRFWITLRSNGMARWQPGGVFAIACALDMNFYPFDDQKCTMEIETWVYTADKVNLTSSENVIGLDTYIPHGEWTMISTEVRGVNKVYKYYTEEQFPEIYFTIFIRRKYTFYFMYILLPCLMLSGVLLMIFLLPADSGEKVSLGVSILVAISVFLLLVAGNVPDTSDAIPIIAIYLTYFMMATTLAVALSVLVIKLHFKPAEPRPPKWMRTFILNYMARVVCMKTGMRPSKSPTGARKFRILRDTTWSETVTEEIRSTCNSHGTLTPEAIENYELLHQRRKPEDNALEVRQQNAGEIRSNGQEVDIVDEPFPDRLNGNEWKRMAEVVDRFFFWLFLAFIIGPTSCILGFVRLFKPELDNLHQGH